MEFEKIMSIMDSFNDSNLMNLNIELGDFKINLKKNSEKFNIVKNQSHNNEEKKEQIDPNYVKAPLVGIYYDSNSPEKKPFVKVGQKVKKGDALCIIEAMKVMNEISSPKDGEVSKVNVQNGEVIGYDQILMEII